MQPTARIFRWPIVPIAVPAAVIGILASLMAVRTPLWRDEYATLSFASLPLGELWRAVTHVDAVLAPYYTLIHVVHGIIPSDLGIRLPSIVGAVTAAACVGWLAHHWWGGRAALVAGFAFALNPLAVQLAATARPYALATAFLALAAVALVKATERPSPIRWILFAVPLAAAGLMHLFALLAVPALAILAVGRRRLFLCWAASTAAAVLVVAPIALLAYSQRDQVAWIGRPSPRSAVGAIASVMTYQADGRFGPWEAVASALLLVSVGLSIFIVVRLPTVSASERMRLLFAAALFLFPWLFLLAYSIVLTPYLRTQYLAPSTLGLALLLGGSVGLAVNRATQTSSGGRAIALTGTTTAIALVVMMGSFTAVSLTKPWRVDDYPSLASVLQAEAEPGDDLLVVQLYNELGVAAGLAHSLADEGFIEELQSQLPDGAQPKYNLRAIEETAPFTTSPRETIDTSATLWIVYTRGALTDADLLGSGLDPERCDIVFDDAAEFGILRLARAECAP